MTCLLEKWQNVPVGPTVREYLGWQDVPPSTTPLSEEQGAAFSADLQNAFIKNKADSFDQFLDIAEELVLMRLPDAALSWFECHAHLPWQTLPRALLHQGSAAMLANRLVLAEDAFRKCQALAPDELAAYINLAQILYKEERDNEAKEWCLAGLKIEPNSERLWELYGAIMRHESATDEECGKRLLQEAQAAHAWAGVSLAALYLDGTDTLLRAQLLEDLYEQGLRDQRFLIELTAALGASQQYEKIPTIVWQAQRLASDEPLAWQLAAHAGQAELGQDKGTQAVQWFETALRSEQIPVDAARELSALCDEIRQSGH